MSKEYILEQLLSPSEAAARLDITVDDLECRRAQGALLALWVKTSRAWVYPAFQFAPGVSAYNLQLLLSILGPRVVFHLRLIGEAGPGPSGSSSRGGVVSAGPRY